MIIFKDWNITATPGVVARQYDNDTRRLEMQGDIPSGWEWTVEVRHGDYFDVIILEPMDGGFGIDLTASQLCLSGNYEMQVRGIYGSCIRYTNALRVFIPENLAGSPGDDGDAEWPKVTSEFKQLEMSAWKAVECAKNVVEESETINLPEVTALTNDAIFRVYVPSEPTDNRARRVSMDTMRAVFGGLGGLGSVTVSNETLVVYGDDVVNVNDETLYL